MNLTLAKISPSAAGIQTLVARHARGLLFEGGGATWRVVGTPVMKTGGVTAYCRAGEQEITVWLDEAGWKTAAALVLDCPAHEVAGVHETLLHAALECFFSDAFAAVEKGLGQPVALEKLVVKHAAIPESACRIEIANADGLRIGLAWVAGRADDGWFTSLEELLLRLPVAESVLPDGLPVPGVVGLAAWRSPASGLDGLAVGDVVLCPPGIGYTLTVGGVARFAASLENGILLVEGKTMTNAVSETEQKDDAPVLVDSVEVELQARVGRLTLPLAQLRQLGEGQVVEFSTPVKSPVTLTVSGMAVATGELVDVGGRIGVRITSMAEE